MPRVPTRHRSFTLPFVLLSLAAAAAEGPVPVAPERTEPSFCLGEYADDLTALSAAARRAEQQQQAYTFCVRTSAVYECPSYGSDGSLRKKRRTASAHGTAFAYRHDDKGTLLLTNQHVAEWPAVTDEDHPVDGIPAGCKRVSDSLRIVDNEADNYAPDDLPLTRVVSDTALDAAVLRTSKSLPTLPWKVGRSSELRVRNVVDVRGFPLGVFSATNVGKVVSEHDHDSFKDWNHDDFVIDALLSQGNSGSPVLAVSCRTGEFELVGLFHAGYTRGSALNVVVGIDQLTGLMTTLKAGAPRPVATLDADRRGQLLTAVRTAVDPYFPFGSLVAEVRARDDGALVYAVLPPDFPARATPVLVMEDLPSSSTGGFGAPGRVWFGNRHGLKGYAPDALSGDVQAQLPRLLDAFRKQSTGAFALRATDGHGAPSREEYEAAAGLQRELDRSSLKLQDLAQAALELSGQLGPATADSPETFADVLKPPVPPSVTTAAPATTGSAAATPAHLTVPATR
jgi:serine protease Do